MRHSLSLIDVFVHDAKVESYYLVPLYTIMNTYSQFHCYYAHGSHRIEEEEISMASPRTKPGNFIMKILMAYTEKERERGVI